MRNYGKLSTLPVTGMGITVAGVTFNQWAIIAIGVGAVLAGAVLVRLAWRRNRPANTR